MVMTLLLKFLIIPFIVLILPVIILSGLIMYYMDPDDLKDPSSNKDGETEGRD
jgi:hypothetical protein